ncbi:MAG TPA: hypothetical protein DIW31_04090 [Bacteroidales bacterium]|nr:hypothetical protein [Bacteroidales bacterium]
MKRLIYSMLFIFFSALLLVNCSSSTEKKTDSNTENKSKKNEKGLASDYDLSTREGFEKLLADFEISLPENSTFKEVGLNSEKNYSISYDVTYFEGFVDSMQNKYEKIFDKVFLEKGWKKPISGWTTQGTFYFDQNMKYHMRFTVANFPSANLHRVIFEYGKN